MVIPTHLFIGNSWNCQPEFIPHPPRLWSRYQGDCGAQNSDCSMNCCFTGWDVSCNSAELDMRRKAEVFKYKKNDAELTKKQKWAQMVRGNGPSRKKVWATQSVSYTDPNAQNLAQYGPFALLCPGTNTNCAPTSASDVPGKGMTLCLDENTPLTRYKVQRTYPSGGTKWPQTAWAPGDAGFPVGKAGGRNLIFR